MAGSSDARATWARHQHERAMRRRKPDFVTVLVVTLALAILAVLTFELWMPHH